MESQCPILSSTAHRLSRRETTMATCTACCRVLSGGTIMCVGSITTRSILGRCSVEYQPLENEILYPVVTGQSLYPSVLRSQSSTQERSGTLGYVIEPLYSEITCVNHIPRPPRPYSSTKEYKHDTILVRSGIMIQQSAQKYTTNEMFFKCSLPYDRRKAREDRHRKPITRGCYSTTSL